MRPRKKVKLQDIAEALGISVVTVSNALAGRKGVSEALREEIVETADAMGYKAPDRREKTDSGKKKRGAVGLILVPDRSGDIMPWQTSLADRLTEELKKETMGLNVITPTRRDIAREIFPSSVSEMNGLIVCGNPETAYLRQLRLHVGAPIVCCGFFDSHEMLDYVLDDGFHNMGLIFGRLTELGHRNIGIVCGKHEGPEAYDHFLGACFEEALRRSDAGELPEMPDPEICTAERFVRLAGDQRATAAVCTDSDTACELVRTLRHSGFRVPEDISVTGYSLDPDGSGKDTAEVIPDIRGIAKQTVKLLMRRLDGRDMSGVRLVPGIFSEGKTIGPVREEQYG